jgi:septal ring factor EnvC (AmiA/AmiB activator)
MTDLPLRCICGYQSKINRLETELAITERRLQQTINNLEHSITDNYALRNKLGEEKKTRTAIEHTLAYTLQKLKLAQDQLGITNGDR